MLQAIFDKVATHLLTQKRRSADNGHCKYRHGSLMCAVGCLITDENYSVKLESLTIDQIPVQNAVLKSIGIQDLSEYKYMRTEIKDLLRSLQSMHDNIIYGPERWPETLQKIAKDYKLEYKHEDKA